MKTLFFNNNERKWQEDENSTTLLTPEQENKLILFNDDHNTFDFVIECLMEICGHSLEQAEQCTILVHYKGKCSVKTAKMETLLPMHQKLLSRGLTSEIQ